MISILMRWRHVVATLVSTLATAGCLFGSSDTQQTELGYLGIVNRDEKAHRVDLHHWEPDCESELNDLRLPETVPHVSEDDQRSQFEQ